MAENIIIKETGQLTEYAVNACVRQMRQTVNDKGSFSIAFSGGSTPKIFLQKLAGRSQDIPWDNVHIFLVDERFVPSSHQDSNFRLLSDNLLKTVSIPADHVHPIITDVTLPVETLAGHYEDEIIKHFSLSSGAFPRFDLILLGIGDDGHTASLFPGNPALTDTKHIAVPVKHKPAKHERISITLNVINNADRVWFLIAGKAKSRIVKTILEEKNTQLPAGRVHLTRGMITYFVDNDAAELLSRSIKEMSFNE